MNEIDFDFMKRCLELASRGEGMVSPSAMVGALVVSEGRIVGEGYYLYDLKKHAEVHALEMAEGAARGATLYCTLEPCSHFGRTPPCADAVIEADISRAVVAIIDPNPQVSGQGIERLRKAGIEVTVGLCAEESKDLNEIYFKFQTTGLPFVHVVLADYSLDALENWMPSTGFLKMAFQYDAIMTGERNACQCAIVAHWFSRPRHRRLTLINTRESDIAQIEITGLYGDRVALLDAGHYGVEMIAQLGVIGVTSLLALPDAHHKFDFRLADRITVVSPSGRTLANLSEGFAKQEETTAGTFIETTYSKRGEA
ncbi:MAG: bifunctional diaminohydroxyphosphoribosylaminopyrimidine deaminase/5-amino-6-(5-phosphoribosylamino)uracil reductase RibD [Acidobacteriota bacterium]